MDNDNLVTALSAQIQINVVLIGTVRKSSVGQNILTKRCNITHEKVQKTIQAKTHRRIRTVVQPSLSRQFRTNDRNLCYHCQVHPVFSITMFTSIVSRRGNRCAQVYATDFVLARASPMVSRS